MVIDDGSTDDTAARARARRRAGGPSPVQPRDRRRRAVGLPVRARARLRHRRAGRRRRPARPALPARAAAPPAHAPRARHGHRLALPRRRRRRLPLLGAAPDRHPHLLRDPVDDRRPARHRSDVGPADDRPPRHRAVRPRLPARLPRGRGGAAHAPPPAARACEMPVRHARAPRRRLLDQLDALGLLHDQGAAGRRSSACSARARRSSRATAPPSSRSTGSEMDVSRLQLLADHSSTAGLFVLVFELVRRRRLLERYALLWLFASAVLLGLSVWRGLLEELAGAVGIFYAPSALFAVAFGFVLILLLHFSLVISRLAEQTKVLAQRVGMLQHQVDELPAALARGGPARRAGRGRAGRGAHPFARLLGAAARGRHRHRRLRQRRRAARDARARCRPGRAGRRAGGRRQRVDRRQRGRRTARRTRRAVLELGDEPGLRGGCHAGAAATTAPLLFLLNPDATLEPGCLDALRATAERAPGLGRVAGARAAAGRRARRTRTAAITHWLGFGWAGGLRDAGGRRRARAARGRRSRRAPRSWSGARRGTRSAASTPSTSCTARTSTCRCACASRAGASASVPGARVEHDYEFAKGDYKWFYLERNRAWTVLGAYPATLLAVLAPALLAFELALLPVAARGGWLRAKLRAQAAVLRVAAVGAAPAAPGAGAAARPRRGVRGRADARRSTRPTSGRRRRSTRCGGCRPATGRWRARSWGGRHDRRARAVGRARQLRGRRLPAADAASARAHTRARRRGHRGRLGLRATAAGVTSTQHWDAARALRFEHNIGFAPGCNRGAEAARGPLRRLRQLRRRGRAGLGRAAARAARGPGRRRGDRAARLARTARRSRRPGSTSRRTPRRSGARASSRGRRRRASRPPSPPPRAR